jgi:hypothetical protein
MSGSAENDPKQSSLWLSSCAATNGCYSITSSARASIVGGTSSPSVFAVLRLIMNSNLVGCRTGWSAGFWPLRMPAGVNASLAKGVRKAGAVAHQPAGFGEVARAI